jgi:transposase
MAIRLHCYYYDKWRENGAWEKALNTLVIERREQLGLDAQPTICAVDSQSVKVAPLICEEKGIDGNKKINGRKRHIIVDSNGLLLGVWISAANKSDGTEGVELLPILQKHYTKIAIIAADGVYKKIFENAAACCGIETQISQKPETQQGFVPQKNRWHIERSFAWLNFYRRLSKDF